MAFDFSNPRSYKILAPIRFPWIIAITVCVLHFGMFLGISYAYMVESDGGGPYASILKLCAESFGQPYIWVHERFIDTQLSTGIRILIFSGNSLFCGSIVALAFWRLRIHRRAR